MRIRNHLSYILVLLSFFSTQAFAEEYSELSACRLHYQTVVQPGATDINAMDNWCLQTAKMDPLNVCADKKLYAFMASNSINSDQKAQYRETYRQACYREQNQVAAAGTQTTQSASTVTSAATSGAVIAATAGVTYATPTATGAPAQPVLNLQDCSATANVNACQAANQSAQAAFARAQATYNTNLATYEAQKKAATELTTQQRQQVQQATSNMVMNAGMQALSGMSGREGSSTSSSSPDARAVVGGADATATPRPDSLDAMANPGGATTNTTNTSASNGGTPAEARQLNQQGSDLTRGQVREGNTSLEEANAEPPPRTETTNVVEQSIQNLKQQVDSVKAEAEALNSAGYTTFGSKFKMIYQELGTLDASGMSKEDVAQSFVAKKNKCLHNAEKAQKFCLEGSSPGMKFAKGLIDYSGPVLALIRSAHKACSDTAKVANVATLAVTMAKGVCVATKLQCDSSCADTKKNAEEIRSRVQTDLARDLKADRETQNAQCSANGALPPAVTACQAVVEQNVARGMRVISTIVQALQKEAGIEDTGSTQNLVAKCASKTKDIALMAVNLAGLVAMRGSAEKCEKQLATGGSGTSGDTSVGDYCSTAANSTTQFCVCQSNPTGEGCATAGLSTPDALASSNQIGANLKTGSGLSGFAGSGAGGGSAGGGSDFGIGSDNGATSGITADLSAKPSSIQGPGVATGGTVGGGSGAGGGSGGDPSAAAAGAKEDKKSVFGSLSGLANSLGGMFGGGRSGGTAVNGALSSQQQAAIQRKIASDKIAGEVTSSSGLDNFSKIKKSYGQKAETLMSTP